MDVDDLYGEDNNNIVIIGFSEENKRRILELETYSTYSGITKNIFVKLTIINNLFEMWIPIVSSEHIQQDKIEEFTNYMLFLKEKIEIPALPNGIVGIDAINHEGVKIRKGLDKKISIEFYRNNMEEPVKRETLIKDEIFTLIKSNHTHPTLSIVSDEESDKVILKGIIYIEGDLIIQSDLEFYGILILQNGGIIVDTTNEVKIQGILLLHNYNDNLMEYEKIESTYNLEAIKTYGIYLPKFIEPNIQVIKSY